MTLRDAASAIQSALDFGNLAAEHAPEGHPIFAAIADAQEALTWVNDQIPWWSSGDSPALPNVTDRVNAITSAIYDAAADLQVDPSQPLPKTTFPNTQSMPWAWLGAGALTIGLAVWAWRSAT